MYSASIGQTVSERGGDEVEIVDAMRGSDDITGV